MKERLYLILIVLIVFLLGCRGEEDSFTQKVLVEREGKHSREVEVYRVKYLSDGLEIGGFLVKPRVIEGRLPVIIYNRGGNRNFSLVDNNLNHLEYLASKGYIVAASQYRGNVYSEGRDEFGGRDVNDVLKLVDIAGKLPYADRKNIFMLGISRGGTMSYIASRKTKSINAMAVVCGNTDIFQLYNEREEKMRRVLRELIGGTPEEKPEEYRERSAYYWAEDIDTPVIIFHGKRDWRVDVTQAEKLSAELERYNKVHELVVYSDTGHSMEHHWPEVDMKILQWFEGYKR